MSSKTVVIGSPVGLHARPAKLLVEAAARQPVPVKIGRSEDKLVDAASILGVMALGVRGGEEVLITAEGEGAESAVAEIAELLARDLDSAEQSAG
ncbi:HPr family phosphocarrier protein [Amycolatopsis balhimycina DSM 5908]|uniref:HPr family phosphocarrier protein n=1 Tax=Amycolatopsis balhimycina DSM 5908 TaxID=1081091 RepID=A0A428VZF3_AMYBA|nr:HPr family phosphocarrier protein [Amycolatopsis balhimycina]RSM36188.1 HPr family phosphocarrier protein [Amycolatopsis balhimycina DSM 5908]